MVLIRASLEDVESHWLPGKEEDACDTATIAKLCRAAEGHMKQVKARARVSKRELASWANDPEPELDDSIRRLITLLNTNHKER